MGPSKTIGIIAGGGSLPLEVARSITARGDGVHLILVDDLADGALKSFPHTNVNWAELGRGIRALQGANVRDVMFLGKYARPSLLSARPDLQFIRALPSVLRILRAGGDDAVLRGLLALFERHGFRIVGAADVAPELLVGEGVLTQAEPTVADNSDIAKGFALVAALGRHDIGQGVVVSGGVIEAIEGAEGTDRMLERVGDNRKASGLFVATARRGVLVKRPKPGQDMRVDVPAIGPATVSNAGEARLAGVAVQSSQVLAASRSDLIAIADAGGLFVAGVRDTQGGAIPAAKIGVADVIALTAKTALSGALKADIARGAAILSDLSSFGVDSAVVIRSKRVLAIGAGEAATAVVARAADLISPKRKLQGVAIVKSGDMIDEALLKGVSAARLAGVAVIENTCKDNERWRRTLESAASMGLFLAKVGRPGAHHD